MKLIITLLLSLTSVPAFADSYSRVSLTNEMEVSMKIQDDVAQKMFEALDNTNEIAISTVQGDVIARRDTNTVSCNKIDHPATGLVTEYACLLSMQKNGAFQNPTITTGNVAAPARR